MKNNRIKKQLWEQGRTSSDSLAPSVKPKQELWTEPTEEHTAYELGSSGLLSSTSYPTRLTCPQDSITHGGLGPPTAISNLESN